MLDKETDKRVCDVLSFPNKDFKEVAAASNVVPIIEDLVDALSEIALIVRHIGFETKFTPQQNVDALMSVFNKVEKAKNFLRDTF